METQEQIILHFEDTFRMLGTESFHAFQRRWHALPHSLQIKEYPSLERLRNALERTPLYKRIMQRLTIKWIGLKFSPPLLLGLHEKRDQPKEQKEWKEIEANASFYPQEVTTYQIPWDVIQATRAMNELHISD